MGSPRTPPPRPPPGPTGDWFCQNSCTAEKAALPVGQDQPGTVPRTPSMSCHGGDRPGSGPGTRDVVTKPAGAQALPQPSLPTGSSSPWPRPRAGHTRGRQLPDEKCQRDISLTQETRGLGEGRQRDCKRNQIQNIPKRNENTCAQGNVSMRVHACPHGSPDICPASGASLGQKEQRTATDHPQKMSGPHAEWPVEDFR